MPPTPEALAAESLATEFDVMMQRAGLTVPPERRTQVLVAYAELRDQVDLLRGRPPTAEPSNIFSLRRMAEDPASQS